MKLLTNRKGLGCGLVLLVLCGFVFLSMEKKKGLCQKMDVSGENLYY